jgi:hypothetical protein
MPVTHRFVPNEAGIQRLLKAPSGAVSRYMVRKAQKVLAAAQAILAGMVKDGTGELESSLIVQPIPTPAGMTVQVIADSPHAKFFHEGTRPHQIRPVQAKVLRFPGSGGVVVFHPGPVNHPGTPPHPFLVTALAAEV